MSRPPLCVHACVDISGNVEQESICLPYFQHIYPSEEMLLGVTVILISLSHSADKWNISCHIKTRTLQSSAIAPTGASESQGSRKTTPAIQQPLLMVSPKETQNVKTQDASPEN